MGKRLISAIFTLIALILPIDFSLAANMASWPATTDLNNRINLTAPYEPSGMAWNSVSEKLFTISDGGVVTKMNKDGVVEIEWRNIKREPPNATANADLEALVITDPHSNFIYLGEENPDSISQFDWSRGVKTGKSWDLSYHLNTPSNSGLEGAAFVPNTFLPSSVPDSIYGSGGLFYVGVQRAPTPGGAIITDDGVIGVVDLNLNETGVFTWRGYITLDANGFTGLANSYVSDMFFNEDTGTLFILYDDAYNLLVEVDPKTNKVVHAYTNVPGVGREGFLIKRNDTGGSIIYIAHDHDTATWISKHTAVYYQDLDGDGLGSDVMSMISTLAAPNGYVSNSNDLNDNDFDNDGISIGVDCNDANNTVLGPVNYYIDADGDGKGFGQAQQSCTVLAGHVTNVEDLNDNDYDNDTISSPVDCNDRDYNIRGPQSYYADLDGDGLGFGEAQLSCTVVSGRVTNSNDQNDNDHDNDNINTGIDCDDSNNTVLGPINYYRDADGDGKRFGEPQLMCFASGAYVLTASSAVDANDHDYDNDNIETTIDCNDRDFNVKGPQSYYADADGDGLGFGSAQESCSALPGRVTNVNDTNDNDFDNDGVETPGDCNDTNNTVFGPQSYFRDADADGRGTGIAQPSCTPLEGYVSNNMDGNDNDYDNDGFEKDGVVAITDCDDHNFQVKGPVNYYRDLDADGKRFGEPQIMCSASGKYILTESSEVDLNDRDFDNDGVDTSIDCDDRNTAVLGPMTLYADNDGDGSGFGAPQQLCTMAVGFVTNNNDTNDNDFDNDGVETSGDCNDHDPLLYFLVSYYKDGDTDGLGSLLEAVKVCSQVPPAGYVNNDDDRNDNDFDNDGVSYGIDCDDKDLAITRLIRYYRDADGDGLGWRNISTNVCSLKEPLGYVSNINDRNDNDFDNDGVSPPKDPDDTNPNVPNRLRKLNIFFGSPKKIR